MKKISIEESVKGSWSISYFFDRWAHPLPGDATVADLQILSTGNIQFGFLKIPHSFRRILSSSRRQYPLALHTYGILFQTDVSRFPAPIQTVSPIYSFCRDNTRFMEGFQYMINI
jgi:hypothetical protein